MKPQKIRCILKIKYPLALFDLYILIEEKTEKKKFSSDCGHRKAHILSTTIHNRILIALVNRKYANNHRSPLAIVVFFIDFFRQLEICRFSSLATRHRVGRGVTDLISIGAGGGKKSVSSPLSIVIRTYK